MSINENSENIDENNNQKKVDLKSDFISEFTKNKLFSSEKNKFIDEVMGKDSIVSNEFLDKELKKFKSKNDKFKDFDISKINIFDLKRAISKEYLKLENARKNYLEHVFSNFDLNEKQREKLEKKIKNKKESELEEMINSEIVNKKFLSKTIGKVDKVDNLKGLKILSEDEIKKRLNKLKDTDKQDIKLILSNLNNGIIDSADIIDLFTTNFFTKKEKQELIKQFIPYISLQEALDIKLINESTAENIKKKLLEKYLKKDFNTDQLKEVIDSTALSDIKVKSSDFFNGEESLNNIAKNIGFSNLEKEFKKEIDEIKKDGIKNFTDLKELLNSSEYASKFNNLGNFNKGNYVKIVEKDSNGSEKITYNKIENISDINQNITFRPVGSNISGKEIINLDNYTITEPISYNNFLDNFKGNEKTASFLTETDIQKQIDSGSIETSDLKQYTAKDLQNSEELVERLVGNYKDNIEAEKQEIEQEITDLENKIQSLEESKNSENKDEIDSQIENLKISLENAKLRLDDVIDLTNANPSTNDLLIYSNKQELIKKLDEIDSEGKEVGLKKGVVLKAKTGIYTVTGIDWETGEIHLESKGKKGLQKEKLSFEDFYNSFKKNEAKRIKEFSNLEDFVKENQEKSKQKDNWNNVIVKDGKLHIKEVPEYSKDKNTVIDFLVCENSDDIFKIEKVDGDKITFRWGERKDINKLDDKEKKKYKKKYKNMIKLTTRKK